PALRAVFARPGVVVAASGTALPAEYRAKGAATVFFVLSLPSLVGDPSHPADPAAVQAAADRVFDQATASTACGTPTVALNELLGSSLPTPWSPTNAQYRANVLALVQRLAQRGAHPALFVHGDPNVDGDAAAWWKGVAQSADIVYEAYYNASNIDKLGVVVGTRRMRLGMRLVAARFETAGVPAARIGFALGFQVAPGAAGREGLQPSQEWFRVVKWEALAARQVAVDEGTSSIWSWGWATFGASSNDPDKPAAACVYLWARDQSLCDGPAAAGGGFDSSLAEGPVVLPPGIRCTFAGGAVTNAAVSALAAVTRDPHLAFTALFARAALRTRVPIAQTAILGAERAAIARAGSLGAYLRALARKHATRLVARGVIADELRRQAIATRAAGTTPLLWAADAETAAVDTATCLRDDMPGTSDFPASNAWEVGVAPLPAFLPFLFADRKPPTPPAGLAAAPQPAAIALRWADSPEPDLVSYVVYRASTPGGPYTRLNGTPLTRASYVDTTPPAGATAYYVVRAVDTSRNRSDPSAEASAAPG